MKKINAFMQRETLVAGARYFGPVFGLGWLLGPVRELLLVPRIGRTASAAVELPLLAAATFASARSEIARCKGDPPLTTRLAIGAVAFALFGALELAGARVVRGLSVAEYATTFRTPAGVLSLVAFAWFACAPAVVKHRRG
jgi:hypothetical protein